MGLLTCYRLAITQCEKGKGSVRGAFKMPTAAASSVKHPDGIYLTARQWTSGVSLHPFYFPSFTFPSSCLSSLSFPFSMLSLHFTPLHSSVTTSDQPPCRQGHSLVQDVCLINEDPDCYYRGGPLAHRAAKSPPLITQLQHTDKRQ